MAGIVRRRATRAALGLSAVLLLAAGGGTASAGLESGYRDIQDFANAGFFA